MGTRFGPRALLSCLLLLALLGAWSGIRSAGHAPTYPDTTVYIHLADTGLNDAYRGMAYPLFLAGIDACLGKGGLRSSFHAQLQSAKDERPASSWSTPVFVVQLVQLLVAVVGLAYFARVFLPWRTGPRALGPALLPVLLLAEPVLGHFQFALLTDGLALSLSLIACAALVRCYRGKEGRTTAAVALLLTTLLVPCLRIEKLYVLAATVLGSVALWWIRAQRIPAAERTEVRTRLLRTCAIAAAGLTLGAVLQCSRAVDRPGWPLGEFVLENRVLYPNLDSVYGDLPADIRARLTREQACHHDTTLLNGKNVIDRLSGQDPAQRERILAALAPVVLRERWGWILRDVLQDMLEAVLAPPTFYCGLVLRRHASLDVYRRMSCRDPLATRAWLVVAGSSLLICSALAVLLLRRRGIAGFSWFEPQDWIPPALFALASAAAFALVIGQIDTRYALFAHACWAGFVLRAALGWIAGRSFDAGTPRAALSACAAG